MSDPLPMFEIVASLGAFVIAMRATHRLLAMARLRTFARRILEFIREGQLERARGLAELDDAPMLPSIARRLLSEMTELPPEPELARKRLQSQLDHATRAQVRRVLSAVLRDIAMAVVLAVALRMVPASSLQAPHWFYWAGMAAVTLLVADAFVRRVVLALALRSTPALLEACAAHGEQASGPESSRRCPHCSSTLDPLGTSQG